MSNDNDTPQSDGDELSPEELAQAEAFGAKTDALLSSLRISPIESAEDRELLELAGIIRASHHDSVLGADVQRSLIDAAFKQALDIDEEPLMEEHGDELASMRKRRASRVIPLAAIALAAAAALFLIVRNKSQDTSPSQDVAQVITKTRELPSEQRSRPADELVGQIGEAEAGAAAARLDRIYDNRLRGYRQLRFDRQVGTR